MCFASLKKKGRRRWKTLKSKKKKVAPSPLLVCWCFEVIPLFLTLSIVKEARERDDDDDDDDEKDDEKDDLPPREDDDEKDDAKEET